jgi:hypothetical protein
MAKGYTLTLAKSNENSGLIWTVCLDLAKQVQASDDDDSDIYG